MCRQNALTIALCGVISGCATLPDVTVSYYFPRAETQFVVTQTIGCTEKESGKHRSMRSVISVAPSTINSADTTWVDERVTDRPTLRRGHIIYSSLGRTFSDSDVTVTLTADGRLSGVNFSSTGAGDTIIKDLVTVVGTVAPFLLERVGGPPTVEDKACDEVDKFALVQSSTAADGKATKFVTLTYGVAIFYDIPEQGTPALVIDQYLSTGYGTLTGPQSWIALVPDAISRPVYDSLQANLGDRMVTKLILRSDANNLRYLDATSPTTFTGTTTLELNRVALVNLAVTGHVANLKDESVLWTGFVPAPTHAVYEVPIPTSVIFGKAVFGISLSDYGTITSLHYASNAGSGTAEALDAFGAVAKALQPKTTADRAKDIQAQADLIAQQQRLIKCQVSPPDCK